MKLGMVDGKVPYTDSTNLKANANKNKFVLKEIRKSTGNYLYELEKDIEKEREDHGHKPNAVQPFYLTESTEISNLSHWEKHSRLLTPSPPWGGLQGTPKKRTEPPAFSRRGAKGVGAFFRPPSGGTGAF